MDRAADLVSLTRRMSILVLSDKRSTQVTVRYASILPQLLWVSYYRGDVPGAIVCPDFATFKLVFSLYTESVTENAANVMTKSMSSQVDGPPMSPPNFERYGCALLPNGSPMKLQSSNGWSVVTARLPNGKTIQGVTLPSMTDYPPEVRRHQLEVRQAIGTRYDEIMQPEIERHAEAIKQESERHVAAMRQINPRYMIGSEGSGLECVMESCQPEMKRHAIALSQENGLFTDRSEAARAQATQANSPDAPN